MLNAAQNLHDLRVPPANRLEALEGNRSGQYSIRINDQWRICFAWRDGHCINEIVLGKRAITADTAVRLAHYFGTSEQLWMMLQSSFDLEEAGKKLGSRLKELDRSVA